MRIKKEPVDFIVIEQTNVQPSSGPIYLYQVTKKDLTTNEMVRRIANDSGVSVRSIRFAGMKDRRAITTQHISSETKLKTSDPLITLELLGMIPEHVHLGALTQNSFEINVYDAPKPIKHAFINYYGDQRFSKQNVERGLLLIKKDFDELAKELSEEFAGVKKALQTKPQSPIDAIRKAPHNILLMYVHSVQSYLFNSVVSAYIQQEYDNVVLVPYAEGELAFPKHTQDMDVPIIGAVQDLGIFESLYQEELDKLRITQQDFLIRAIPPLTMEGTTRSLLCDVREYNLSDNVVKLTLGPGSYATVCLSAIFGVQPLLE